MVIPNYVDSGMERHNRALKMHAHSGTEHINTSGCTPNFASGWIRPGLGAESAFGVAVQMKDTSFATFGIESVGIDGVRDTPRRERYRARDMSCRRRGEDSPRFLRLERRHISPPLPVPFRTLMIGLNLASGRTSGSAQKNCKILGPQLKYDVPLTHHNPRLAGSAEIQVFGFQAHWVQEYGSSNLHGSSEYRLCPLDSTSFRADGYGKPRDMHGRFRPYTYTGFLFHSLGVELPQATETWNAGYLGAYDAGTGAFVGAVRTALGSSGIFTWTKPGSILSPVDPNANYVALISGIQPCTAAAFTGPTSWSAIAASDGFPHGSYGNLNTFCGEVMTFALGSAFGRQVLLPQWRDPNSMLVTPNVQGYVQSNSNAQVQQVVWRLIACEIPRCLTLNFIVPLGFPPLSEDNPTLSLSAGLDKSSVLELLCSSTMG
ncbi:hypothetical protein B0H13DRAFT_1934353 [Mycena leptocephala]|nr:hypothetical protein B0H13DRAFT_1934353 [Mycena leptocephala]